MPVQYYRYDKPFTLESGVTLPELTIAYHTFGTRRGDNVLWVCHALTANSDVADWWPHTVEKDKFLDPERYFTVCANILGSHYGTTGPLSLDPSTGKPYYGTFPVFTLRDIARAHLLLADHLNIRQVRALMGSSIGGYQVLEMALLRPGFARRLILIATAARNTPWTIAWNESQRMAIEADASWGEPSPEAGLRGMAVARSMGLLSYRGCAAYNATQQEHDNPDKTEGFRACSYQRYQGEKLCRRFNAYSYYRISQAFDSHNIGRGRGGVEQALASLTMPCLVIGISSDLIFPVEEQRYLHEHLPQSRFEVIDSSFGHDGFLVEHRQLNALLGPFIAGV